MTGKGGDYDGWILRLIDKAEDILHSTTMAGWLAFAVEKIEAYSGVSITKAQVDVLKEKRDLVFELPEEMGIFLRTVTRYRDSRGRWSKEPTDRAETKTVFRGEGQKFISKGSADTLLGEVLDARGIRKKERKEGE